MEQSDGYKEFERIMDGLLKKIFETEAPVILNEEEIVEVQFPIQEEFSFCDDCRPKYSPKEEQFLDYFITLPNDHPVEVTAEEVFYIQGLFIRMWDRFDAQAAEAAAATKH